MFPLTRQKYGHHHPQPHPCPLSACGKEHHLSRHPSVLAGSRLGTRYAQVSQGRLACSHRLVNRYIKGLWSQGVQHQGSISQLTWELITEILQKFSLLWLSLVWSNQITNVHMSQQLSCCDMCKFVIWLDHYFNNKSSRIFCKICLKGSWTLCEMKPRALADHWWYWPCYHVFLQMMNK